MQRVNSKGTMNRMNINSTSSHNHPNSQPSPSKEKDRLPFPSSLFSACRRYIILIVLLTCIILYFATRKAQDMIIEQRTREPEKVLSVIPKCSTAGHRGDSLGLDFGSTDPCPARVNRLLMYCSEHIHAGSEGPGDVNEPMGLHFNNAESFELVHLFITIRHGDRSAIHVMPGSHEQELQSKGILTQGRRDKDEQDMQEDELQLYQKRQKTYAHAGLEHPIHGSKYLDITALDYVPSLSHFNLIAMTKPTGSKKSDNVDHVDIIDGNEVASNSNELSLEQTGKLPIKPSETTVPSMDVKIHAAVSDSHHNDKHEKHEGVDTKGKLPYDALSPTMVFSIPDTDLAPGQLTTRGFMQHITLGGIFNKAYHHFIESTIHAPEHIRVRSTNYARTIQSVSAFLLGMIPDIGSKDMPISITSYVNENEEVMHGVGLVLSSKDTGGNGDKEIVSICQRSVDLAKKQKQSLITTASVQQRIESLFGYEAKNRFITDVADSSLPKICHNRPLPCSDKGCLEEDDLGYIMAEADKAFCNRYTGDNGGQHATKLSIYPFMKEISDELLEAAVLQLLWRHHDILIDYKRFVGIRLNSDNIEDSMDNLMVVDSRHGKAKKGIDSNMDHGSNDKEGNERETKSNNGSNNDGKDGKDGKDGDEHRILNRRDRQRVTIFSGHDTVIAPVLAAMGVYKDHDCIWPPYASRIAFELYQYIGDNNDKTDSSFHTILKSVRVKYGSESTSEQELKHVQKLLLNAYSDATSIEAEVLKISYVRVLYNGRDVTGAIPPCEGKIPCPLRVFKGMVEGLIKPARTLEEGCSA